MALVLSNVGPPASWMAVATGFTEVGHLVLFDFEVGGQLARSICFRRRPEELYAALTVALDRKWKGERIKFSGGGFKGSLEWEYDTRIKSGGVLISIAQEKITQGDILLVLEISPPGALEVRFSVNDRQLNAIRNKMAILLDKE